MTTADQSLRTELGANRQARTLAAYSAPSLGIGFVWGLLSLYFLKFSTDVLLLAPATVGLIFALSRIWDGVTDPIVGILSDRTRGSLGRRRPWMLASAVPLIVLFYALWSPPAALTGGWLLLWVAATLLLLYTALTMLNVPHKALGAELEPGHHEKTSVFAASGFSENIGFIFAAAALSYVESAALPRDAASHVALMGGLLIAGGIVWCVLGVPEQSAYRGRGGHDGPFKGLRAVLLNRYARLLLAVFFLELLGQTLFTSALPYFSDYAIGMPEATFHFLGSALAATLISIPIWSHLSRKFGKVRLWRLSLLGKVFVFAGIFFVSGADDYRTIIALSVLFGLMSGCGVAVAASIKADVVDADEADTGSRREGLYFSTWNMVIKMGIAMALALAGFVLGASGFVPNVEQPATALLGIHSLVSLLPLGFHFAAFIVLLGFHLDEREHEKIRRRIAMMRRALETP